MATKGNRIDTDAQRARRHMITQAVAQPIERLEVRRLMTATQDVGGLRFVTDGTFANNGTLAQTHSAVRVGLVPQTGAAFKALLDVAGGVAIDTAATTQKFVTSGALGVVTGAAVQTVAAVQQTLNIADLLNGGASIANGTNLAVGAQALLPNKLKLVADAAGSVARLGGQFDFAALASGFTLDDATSYVTAGLGDALQATLANGLSLRGDFTAGGTRFKGSLKVLQYDAANDTLALSGTSAFTVGKNTFDITVGTDAASGLNVVNGKLAAFNFTTTSSFSVAAATFTTKGLNATYDTAKSTFGLKGSATVTLGENNSLAVELGDKATDGLIVANGSLSTLNFTASGAVSVGGSGIKLDALNGAYNAAAESLVFKGMAALTFASQTVGVDLGANETAGLVFTNGAVTGAGGVVTADLSIGGATLKSAGLTTNYLPATRQIAVRGEASLDAGATKINVQLGSQPAEGAASQGLLVQDGKVAALDAAVTGEFTVLGTTFKAEGLHVTYASDDSTYRIDGKAGVAFKVGDKASKLDATFGTAAKPGLVVGGGSVKSLAFTADGNLALGNTNLTARGLLVTRDATNALTAVGKAGVAVGATSVDLNLGSTVADGVASKGVLFRDGVLESLDAAATGSFSVAGASFKADALHVIYHKDTSDLAVDGKATLSFKTGDSTSSLTATFGTAKEPGLVITDGSFKKLAVTADGNIALGGTNLTAKALLVTRDSGGALTITGNAGVTVDKTTIDFKLGSTDADGAASKGIVINDGALQSLDAAVTGGFAVSGASVKADGLRLVYAAASKSYQVDGKASIGLKVGDKESILSATFGTSAKPGLSFAGGSFQKLDITADGNLALGSVNLTTKGLRITRDAAGLLTATGDAGVAFETTTIDLKLGSTAADGAISHGVVFKDGSLVSLDAAVTGSFSVAGTSFKADALHFVYVTATSDLAVDGKASASFKVGDKTSTLAATFGTAAKPGLIVSGGKLAKLDFIADGNLAVGSVNLAAKALAVTRDPTAGTLAVTGNSSLTVGNTTIGLKLGSAAADGAASKGLVFRDGTLESLDAAVTGGFEVSGVSFKADALHLVYVSATTDLAIDGKTTLSFKAGGKTSSVTATFGTDKTPGLIIGGGDFKKLDVTADGTLNVGGLALTAKALNFVRQGNGDLIAKGALGFEVGGAKLEVALGNKDSAGLVITNGELKTLDAAVTSEFSFSGVKFTTKSLRFAWSDQDGKTAFELTGDAAVTFNAGGKTSTLAVGFGLPGLSGLRIVDGKFEEMTLKISGEANIAGLSVKATDLAMAYKPSISRFAVYGTLELSTAGGKVLDGLKATLGKSFDAPGIELTDGQLTRLEIAVGGNVKLGPLTATAHNLRVAYRKADSLLTISGGLTMGLAGGTVSAALPDNGLRINTVSGDVQLTGLSLRAGGFRVGAVEIKNLHLDYRDDGAGNFGYGGGLLLGINGSETGASFSTSFVNNQLSSMALTVSGSLRIGTMTITRFAASVSGLETGGSLAITGGVTAVIPGTKNINLLTIDGSLLVNSKVFELDGNAVVFNRSLLEGRAVVKVDFEQGTFDFNGSMRGLNGALEGNASLRFSIATGYFDASASLKLKVPDGVRFIGGTEIGSAKVQIKYGPETTYTTQAVLPSSIRQIGRNDARTTVGANERLGKGYVTLSPDGSYKLTMQEDGNLVLYNLPMNRAVWATGTRGDYVDMQADGNLVMYSDGRAVWSSNTYGNSGATLGVQNDGNLVIYASDGRALWSSGTNSNENARLIAMVIRIAGETDSGVRSTLVRDAVNSRQFGHITTEELMTLVDGTQVRRAATNSRFLQLYGEASVAGLKGTASYVANLDTSVYKATVGYDVYLKSGVVDVASNGDPRSLPSYVVVDALPSGARGLSRTAAAGDVFARSTPVMSFDPSIIAKDLRAMKSTSRAPVARISGVSVDASKNSAAIKYVVSSDSPASVSIFVDTDASGWDGYQIDPGLIAKRGTQTLAYNDLAAALPADAASGQRLYFYARVDDGVHDAVYSAYSVGITPKNMLPSVHVPTDLQYASSRQPLRFSSRFLNAITVSDPLAGKKGIDSVDTDLTVEIDTEGQGFVTIHKLPRGVTIVGNRTEWITLTGQSALLNVALQSLSYTPFTGAESDAMYVAVRRTNSLFPENYAEQKVDIEIDNFYITGFDDLKFTPNGSFQALLPKVYIEDPYSDTVTKFWIDIDGYRRGVDKLQLNPKGLRRIFNEGITATFDERLGRLTFDGLPVRMGTAVLLLRQVEFASTNVSKKAVVVNLHNGTADISETELRLDF